MIIDEKIKSLSMFFMLSPNDRIDYLSGRRCSTELVYNEDGDIARNVLEFLCINYADLVDEYYNSDVSDETFSRELLAVLAVIMWLKDDDSYVWDYEKGYSGGVFDDLWLVVSRLSRAMYDFHGWDATSRLVDVDTLIGEFVMRRE